MDKTLREYLEMANSIHAHIDQFILIIKPDELEEKISTLHKGIKTIQSIAKRMADVSNICNHHLLRKKKSGYIPKYVDPYPKSTDYGVLNMQFPRAHTTILPEIKIPVKIVKQPHEVPPISLYYISSLRQYAININGILIKGNIANIKPPGNPLTTKCQYGINCKSFIKKQECKYYHDPEDYIKMGLSPPDRVRNFTPGSWIYSRTLTPKTYFCRHTGSYDTLEIDIRNLRKVQYQDEISNREYQLIHDLLIYLTLCSKGLVPKYAKWL
jgi:hypothetical protein